MRRASALGFVVLLLAGCSTSGHPGATTWLSGASGSSVPTGQFAAWRGSPVTIAGTYSDNDKDMTEFYQLQPGGDYASWKGDLDIAIGAIGPGESWAAAATGAYDARWTESLQKLQSYRGGLSSTTYIRFAHEMNGNWYPWSVNSGNKDAFVVAWKRFRALQQQIFPQSKLVFSVNRESVGSGFDWRQSFPGKDQVDVLAVDYYNQYPFVNTAADWDASVDAKDSFGAPKGLDAHLAFAKSQGLPFAVSEWSSNSTMGDAPQFVREMRSWFEKHSGNGAGQLRYELQFDVTQNASDQWGIYPETKMPEAAAEYRQLW